MADTCSDLIDTFLSDDSVGAGNYVRKIYQYMDSQLRNRALLQIDSPLRDEMTEYSLREIIELSNKYAAGYYEIGIRAKDPVVLFFDDNINYFFQFVALTYIGAIPVFINSLLDINIFAKFVIKMEAIYIVSTTKRIEAMEQVFSSHGYGVQSIDVEKLKNFTANSTPVEYLHGNNDVVLVAHTSGTTGIPKAVQFTHEALCFGIKKEIRKLPVTRVLSILPHSHGAALSILMSSLLRGATIRIQTQKEVHNILNAIENYKPDFIASFPKIFVDLCREDLSTFDLSSVKYWLSTGDASHEPHVRKLIQQGHHMENGEMVTGSCFIDNLGSSECAFAIFRNIHTTKTNNYNRYIGVPFEWTEAVVLAENGKRLSANTVGYLGVKSKSVTKGYWNNSNITEKNTLAGYWLTGDLVYKNEDGVFFHVDRTTDSIATEQGVLYSCQSEEWLLSHMPELFEVSIVGNRVGGKTEIVTFIEMQTNEEFCSEKLKSRINTLFSEKGWPLISSVIQQTAHENVGVTGKKLKRKLRDDCKKIAV